MKKILLLMVMAVLGVCLTACSDDEPASQQEDSVYLSAKEFSQNVCGKIWYTEDRAADWVWVYEDGTETPYYDDEFLSNIQKPTQAYLFKDGIFVDFYQFLDNKFDENYNKIYESRTPEYCNRQYAYHPETGMIEFCTDWLGKKYHLEVSENHPWAKMELIRVVSVSDTKMVLDYLEYEPRFKKVLRMTLTAATPEKEKEFWSTYTKRENGI